MDYNDINIIPSNDKAIIPSLITSFDDDPSYFSRSSFLTRLNSKQVTIFLLEVNKSLTAYCLCETANDVFHMYRFKFKDGLSYNYFFELVSFVYNFGSTQNVHYFRCSRDFNPSSELQNRFSTSGFSLHERFFMTLHLSAVHFEEPSLDEQYSSSSAISDNLDTIATCIYESVKDTIDALLYPEYHTVESISHLFGLKDSTNNEYDNQASILLFSNNTVVGLNLVGFDGEEKAYISQLAIHPDHRRSQLGTYLMIKSLISLKQMGKKVVYLHVSSGNPAQKLYESVGFKIKESRWVILKQYDH